MSGVVSKSVFTLSDLEKLMIGATADKLFIIKFGAPWCGPCKRIKEPAEAMMSKIQDTYGDKVMCINICIDSDLELFGQLKKHRIVQGVPAILAYRGTDMQDPKYQPMDSVSGGNIDNIEAFFKRCEGYLR